MPVIARTGAMLVIGHKAPMETSAIACRSESLNQRRKADRLKQVSGPQRCRPTPSRLVTQLSEVEASDISFLIPPYLPKGKQTLLVGDPGEGKTWIALDIAARVTRGWDLPTEIP